MAEVEGKWDNENSEDKLSNTFEALLIDVDKVEEQHSDSYFTLVESLLTILVLLITTANTLIDDLTSLSFIY